MDLFLHVDRKRRFEHHPPSFAADAGKFFEVVYVQPFQQLLQVFAKPARFEQHLVRIARRRKSVNGLHALRRQFAKKFTEARTLSANERNVVGTNLA
jgi:hypothetical protein